MLKKIAVICFVVLLFGCGRAATLVVKPVEQIQQVLGAMVKAGEHDVEVPDEMVARLRGKIEEGLHVEHGYGQSDDLLISFKFLQYNEGDQFARWFLAGLTTSGKGTLIVSVTYSDASGTVLGETKVKGKISGGFVGGSINEAVTKVAEDIVNYTLMNFPRE